MAEEAVTTAEDPATQSRHHHGSHRHLIDTPTADRLGDIDAIIVPTARHAAAVKPAIDYAAKLDCRVVLLSSKWSKPAEVVAAARGRGAEVVVVDAHQLPQGLLPRFETSELLANTRRFNRRTDTSAKRNLGLLIAKLAGWERIVFLDDDITVPDPLDLARAAELTTDYAGVGLSIDAKAGSPDNSVVCHAYRDAGGKQDMFIGGGALAVGAGSLDSFFPNIYNEDWFFLLGEDALRPLATTGRAVQKPYDPFADPQRARREELGDCLAEGLFWLLDEGKSIAEADRRFWRGFLRHRVDFISDVIAMVDGMDAEPAERSRMLTALRAARGRCQYIWPETCVEYVASWREDRTRWRAHLKELETTQSGVVGVSKALATLGLTDRTTQLSG
jgi:hypothetical protein